MKKNVISFVILFTLYFHPQFANAQSPYEKNLKKDGLIISCGAGLVIVSEILTRNIDPLTLTEINSLSKYDINRFDRSAVLNYSPQLSHASDILIGTCILSPMMLLLDEEMWEDKNTIIMMHLESILLTGFFTNLIKMSGRIRPFLYNPEVPLQKKLGLKNEARVSFPSRHTSLAFASAVLFSKVFYDFHPNSKFKPYIWAGTLSAASIVGYLRYASGDHFPTDILTGAALGSAVGYFVPYFHKKKNLSFQPSYQMEQCLLTIKFQF